MYEFIKTHTNARFLITFFGTSALGLAAPLVMKFEPKHFSFANFITIFALATIPWLVLLVHSYAIRKSLTPNEPPGFGKYFGSVVAGSFLVGLPLFPLLLVFMLVIIKLEPPSQQNVAHANFVSNAIFLPAFYPVFFYYMGAYSQIVAKCSPSFSIRAAFDTLKPPYLAEVFKGSLFVYVMPMSLRLVSYGVHDLPYSVHVLMGFLQILSSVLGVYLVMHLAETRIRLQQM